MRGAASIGIGWHLDPLHVDPEDPDTFIGSNTYLAAVLPIRHPITITRIIHKAMEPSIISTLLSKHNNKTNKP